MCILLIGCECNDRSKCECQTKDDIWELNDAGQVVYIKSYVSDYIGDECPTYPYYEEFYYTYYPNGTRTVERHRTYLDDEPSSLLDFP